MEKVCLECLVKGGYDALIRLVGEAALGMLVTPVPTPVPRYLRYS